MTLDFSYLKNHLFNHPVSYRYVVLYPFIAAAFISSILCLMILNNMYPKLAQAIISENLAPLTFEVACYISLSYLTIRVMRRGLIEDLGKEGKKFLCFHVPSTAVAIKATYSGIVFGAVVAVVLTFDKLPPPITYSALFNLCVQSFLLTSAIYLFFSLITITPTTAPNYGTKGFLRGLKILCGLLLLVATGRFATLMILTAAQLDKAT